MKYVAFLLALLATPAAATEIKLDDAMIQKLGPLCQAGIFGSRMIAEPICMELSKLVQEAQKSAAPPKPPSDVVGK